MSTLDLSRWGIAMDGERASFVRWLRVDLDCSWRIVAKECAAQWGGQWGADPLIGVAICRAAAAELGEPKAGWT